MLAETWTGPRAPAIAVAVLAVVAALPDRPPPAPTRETWLFVRNRAAEPVALAGIALFGAPVLDAPRLLLPGQCVGLHFKGPEAPFETDADHWRIEWLHRGGTRWVRWSQGFILDLHGAYATSPTTRTCVPCGPAGVVEATWDARLAVPETAHAWDAGDYRSPAWPVFR